MEQLININQLEFLTRLGVEEDTIDLFGTKFSFRTLTVDENTQSFEIPTKEQYQDDVAKFNAMRIEVLARAITRVNGIAIPDNFKDKIKAILKRCQQLALNKLFDSYQELVKRQEKNFTDADSQLDGQVPAPAIVTAPVPPPAPPAPPPQVVAGPMPEMVRMAAIAADEPVSIVNPSGLMGGK